MDQIASTDVFGEIPKMNQNWDPLCRVFQLLNPFQAVHFWTFADLAGRRTDGADAHGAAAHGRWLLVGQRNVIGASRNNLHNFNFVLDPGNTPRTESSERPMSRLFKS